MGINATVGGGTRMLEHLRSHGKDIPNINQIHIVANGTLTAIFSDIAGGVPLGQAVQRAVTMRYAEPGASDQLDVIRQEATGDYPKKIAILFNYLGLGKLLEPNDLHFDVSASHAKRAVEEAQSRRFIVSLFGPKASDGPEDDIVGGFDITHDGWQIVGGFRDLTRNPMFRHLGMLSGAGNGAVIGLGPDNTDGVCTVVGDGAGAGPTVNTMLDDWLSISIRRAAA